MSPHTNAGASEGPFAAPNQNPTKQRRLLQAHLSSEAHRSLRTFVEASGISISATLESFAGELDRAAPAESAIDLDRIVAGARTVDAQRRRRGGKEG